MSVSRPTLTSCETKTKRWQESQLRWNIYPDFLHKDLEINNHHGNNLNDFKSLQAINVDSDICFRKTRDWIDDILQWNSYKSCQRGYKKSK